MGGRPWALASHSWMLAAVSVVALIGLPTLFSTPRDKANVIIAVPGWATILLVLLQLAAAVISSWLAWPAWAAIPVTLLAMRHSCHGASALAVAGFREPDRTVKNMGSRTCGRSRAWSCSRQVLTPFWRALTRLVSSAGRRRRCIRRPGRITSARAA